MKNLIPPPTPPAPNAAPARGVDSAAGPPFGTGHVVIGAGILVTFVGVALAWALLAPLESAVVAPGVVVVDSHIKTVQHLEGGIVEAILVREGDAVSAGDLLITLRETMPASSLNEVRSQYFEAMATLARLSAERDGAVSITIPEDLLARGSEEGIRAAIAGQESVFRTRRSLMEQQFELFERTVAGLEIEIEGLEAQIAASRTRLSLLEEELAAAVTLLDKGLTNRPKVLALKGQKAEIEGAIAVNLSSIGVARQRIEEARLRRTELEAATAADVVGKLDMTRTRAYELAQRLAAAEDVMQRTQIRSPADGIVMAVRVHTIGGVVGAGEPLMEIVPGGDKLVVQVSIDALDIDQVEVGLPATIWLWAVNRRTRAALDGTLTMLSADRVVDPRSGAAFYAGRVVIDAASVEDGVALQPGMGADVMVRTGARTVWEYISEPIARFIRWSLREE